MSSPILYIFSDFLPNWLVEIINVLRRSGLNEIWILLLLTFIPTYFLTSLGGRIANLIKRILDIISFFINGYYRILYMMNPGFRTVSDTRGSSLLSSFRASSIFQWFVEHLSATNFWTRWQSSVQITQTSE